MVVWMLVISLSSLPIFLKSWKKTLPLMLWDLKKVIIAVLQVSKDCSSTSMMATYERIFPSGRISVGTVLECLRRLLFLKNVFMKSNIIYWFTEAINSRISRFASFHLGTSILVPITSTTFAAIIEPTTPQTFKGIPRECA